MLNEAQVKCLASLARAEVLAAMRAMGRGSVKDLALATGKSIETTHYHVRELAETGLFKAVGKEPSGKRHSTLYSPSADRFVFPRADLDPSASAHVPKAIRAMLRLAEVEYGVIAASGIDETGEKRSVVARILLQLTESEMQDLLQKVRSTNTLARTLSKAGKPVRAAMTVLITPLPAPEAPDSESKSDK